MPPTVEPLPQLPDNATLQDILNRVWDVFVTRAAPIATNHKDDGSGMGPNCVYSHDPNGYGCAIGCCLSPTEAKLLDYLGGSIASLRVRGAVLPPFLQNASCEALTTLQQIHDNCPEYPADSRVAYFRDRLTTFATDHNLTIPYVTP